MQNRKPNIGYYRSKRAEDLFHSPISAEIPGPKNEANLAYKTKGKELEY